MAVHNERPKLKGRKRPHMGIAGSQQPFQYVSAYCGLQDDKAGINFFVAFWPRVMLPIYRSSFVFYKF